MTRTLFTFLVALGWLAAGAAVSAQSASDDSAAAASGHVRPGDRIELRIWNEEEMSDEYLVDERGEAVLPRLGPVAVDHLTPGELREVLREAYAEYLRNPAVEITVLRRIGVHGEVKEPTLYWVDVTMTLRDVIALAGGLTPEGDPDEIEIVRGSERIPFDEAESLTMVAARLQSGDQIAVGRRSWLALNTPWVVSTGISLISILAGFLLAR